MDMILTLLILLVLGFLSYVYLKEPHNHFKKLGIPGPPPVFIFGNIALNMRSKFMHDIDKDRIEKYGKVVGTYVGREPYLLVADVDLLKNILVTNFDKFCDRQDLTLRGVLKHCLFDVKGDKWKRQRKQVARYFHMENMKQNITAINHSLDSALQELEEKSNNGEMIECKSFFGPFTLQVITAAAYGIGENTDDRQEVLFEARKIFNDATKINTYLLLRFFVPEVAKFLDWFKVEVVDTRYFRICIRSLLCKLKNTHSNRSSKVNRSFVSTLLEGVYDNDNQGMSDDEIVANSIMFFLAGYDTTASSLSFLIYNFVVNQDCQEKAYQEIVAKIGNKRPTYDTLKQLEYLQKCMDESLRLYPPGTRTTRQCVQDCIINNNAIRKRTRIVIPIWYLHRHPDVWPNPDEFDPERFTKENIQKREALHYCPFGAGPKNCIGIRLATLVIKLALVRVLQKFKLVKNSKTEVPLVMDPSAGFLLRSKNGIWLSLVKRNTSV